MKNKESIVFNMLTVIFFVFLVLNYFNESFKENYSEVSLFIIIAAISFYNLIGFFCGWSIGVYLYKTNEKSSDFARVVVALFYFFVALLCLFKLYGLLLT